MTDEKIQAPMRQLLRDPRFPDSVRVSILCRMVGRVAVHHSLGHEEGFDLTEPRSGLMFRQVYGRPIESYARALAVAGVINDELSDEEWERLTPELSADERKAIGEKLQRAASRI